MYYFGVGAEKNPGEAFRNFQQAAFMGYAPGSYSLGFMNRYGVGIPVDLLKAIKLLKLSAPKYLSPAFFDDMSETYHKEGVPIKDMEDSFDWYRNVVSLALRDMEGRERDLYLLKPDGECERLFLEDPILKEKSFLLGPPGAKINDLDIFEPSWSGRVLSRVRADACCLLGLILRDGAYIRKSRSEALQRLREAADNGNHLAEKAYGELAILARTPPRGHRGLASWLLNRAEAGDLGCMHRLGLMYLKGDGVPFSQPEALKWLKLAADSCHGGALTTIGDLYRYGEVFKKDLRAARDSYQMGAKSGCADAYLKLGSMWEKGEIEESKGPDMESAMPFYLKAAELGSPEAAIIMGDSLSAIKDPSPRDASIAFRWFKKAADLGNRTGNYKMGVLLIEGKGVLEDTQAWVRHIQKAASFNVPDAQYYLGKLFLEGKGVKREPNRAIKWFSDAADSGHMDAQYMLGLIYNEGTLTKKCLGSALKYYSLAAEQNHPEAIMKVNQLRKEKSEENKDLQKSDNWLEFAIANANKPVLPEENTPRGSGFSPDNPDPVAQIAPNAPKKRSRSPRMILRDMIRETDVGIMIDGLSHNLDPNSPEIRKMAAALFDEANACFLGKGVPEDKERAAMLYRKSADMGYKPAIYALMLLYESGMGVEKNKSEALRYLDMAAKKKPDIPPIELPIPKELIELTGPTPAELTGLTELVDHPDPTPAELPDPTPAELPDTTPAELPDPPEDVS
jgi:TPR repeat protein